MRNTVRTSELIMIVILSGLVLSACGAILYEGSQNNRQALEPNPSSGSAGNGERIYFTATNSDGEWIEYSEGPDFGDMMMGSYLTCASCHGPEARGGYHVMHMTPMDAPDIRYNTLINEEDEHGETVDEHEDEHSEYDVEDFRKAVIEGNHPSGEPLSRLMPRWEMSESDLKDLFEFLKTIP